MVWYEASRLVVAAEVYVESQPSLFSSIIYLLVLYCFNSNRGTVRKQCMLALFCASVQPTFMDIEAVGLK